MITEKPHLQVGTCCFRVPMELDVTGCWPGLAALPNRATRATHACSSPQQQIGTRHSAYASTFASQHVTSLGLARSQLMLGKLFQHFYVCSKAGSARRTIADGNQVSG